MELQEYVRKLCRVSGLHVLEIAALAGRTRGWVDAWMAGRIKNAGVIQIEKLHKALTGRDLV